MASAAGLSDLARGVLSGLPRNLMSPVISKSQSDIIRGIKTREHPRVGPRSSEDGGRILGAKALAAVLVSVAVLSAAAACGRGPEPTPTFPAIPPAWPFVFNGDATVGGQPVQAGMLITGRIAEYRSAPVTTQEGRYSALPVGPLDRKFFDRPIVFELKRPSDGKTVVAEQTLVFRALPEPSLYELDLTFPAFD